MTARVSSRLAVFVERHTKELVAIERARCHPPARSVVERRTLAYAAAFDEAGANVQRGFQLRRKASAQRSGPQDPIAADAVLVLLM